MSKKTKLKIIWKNFALRLFLVLCLSVLCYGVFLGCKLYKMESKIVEITENTDGELVEPKSFIETAKALVTNDKLPLRGDTGGRTNILLLGMSGEGYKSQYLTDTIMLVSIDTNNYQSAMLSIPRDLYTEIPQTNGYHTKINAIYTFSVKNKSLSTSESMGNIKTVMENVTGQKIHYYLTLDFLGFKNIITELGGIDLEVKEDIYDSSYPGPNYSYETFEIKKGFQHLDAETALKYARVRHVKGGDFGRASRQQQVLAAAKKKAFSLETIANPTKISSLIDTLGDHLKTDIQLAEIPAFIDLANKINIYQMTSKVLDAWSPDSLLGSTHVEMGGVMAYVLIPKTKNYKQIHELSKNIFDLEKIKRKQAEIKKENARLAVIFENKNKNSKIRVMLNNFGYHATINPTSRDLPVCPLANTILSVSDDRKIFTLDDLASKLDAEIEYHDSKNLTSNDEFLTETSSKKFDIIVCLSADTLDYFEMQNEKQNDSSRELQDQSILDENGSVLFKKE